MTVERSKARPALKDEHLTVFDCAFKALTESARFTIWPSEDDGRGSAFISGAISKTVNLPSEVTRREIEKAYIEGWRLGLKAVAIYRDGSKRTQP
jgi:ribonucleoside-diphosphate reductase alpha chain